MLRSETFLLLVYIVTRVALGVTAIGEDALRETDYGEVKGSLREVADSVFIEHYLGIPYAAPPLGNLRWRPPQRHPGWSNEDDPLDATRFRSFCPHLNFTGNPTFVGEEDCLHLNIYVPYKNYTSDERPLAVFFWIHGGGYMLGSSDFYDSHFAWYADVILVTINYRLGALGFMSTGDSHSPGNFGMLDMIAALQWVHENIGYFGGDKDRVTIGGESAGACAVQLLALSDSVLTDENSQLFHRVIAQSGSAFSSFAFDRKFDTKVNNLFRRLSCPTYSNMLAMECMRSKDVTEILQESSVYGWAPVQDGELFSDTPQTLASLDTNMARLRGRYDYLAGSNSFDSGALYSRINEVNDTESFMSFIQVYLSFNFKDTAKMADAVFLNYIDWSTELPSDPDEWKRLAINVTRDKDILAPSLNFSNIASLSEGFDSNVYYYLFTPRPSDAIANTRWAYSPDDQYDWVTGNRHAEELPYVFGVPLVTDEATEAEKEVSLQMMKYWGNFVRYGDPNNGSEVASFWPKYDEAGSQFIILGGQNEDSNNVTRVEHHLESDKVIFWSKEIPLYKEGDGTGPGYSTPELNATDPEEAFVNTTTGALRGLHIQREKYSIDRFFRIPYAKPPTGLLRFQPPQPHPGWEGILDCDDRSSAKQWLHICPQRNLRGNGNVGRENCLFLNIWVPGGVNVEKEQPLPVLVWIYGGGFNIGTSIGFTFFYDMEKLVNQGSVIGVTLNYRLNSLGFLSTGDENAPGNMGLLDQTAALQWIQDNIAKFGGDPGKVTIFGESAGGAAVSLHMISPLSKSLFHRGIAESGAVPSTWTYLTNPLPQAISLATKLGCPTDNTKLLVGCLRDKPLKDLISESVGESWNAVVDGYFVPDDPKYMLNASIDKDYIIGHNSMEGHSTMSFLFPRLNFAPDRPGSNMDRQDVRRAARFVGSPDHVSEAVAYNFIEWEEPESAYLWPRLAVTYMATEWTFSVGPYVSANVRAESSGPGKTYMYIFGENSRIALFPYWVEANHLREMVYTFGHPFEDTSIANRFTDSDRVLSLAMMTYWTNFAWTGNPNLPNQVDIPVEWPGYTSDSKVTIFFNTSMPEEPEKYLLSNYRGDIMHMWQEILYNMRDLPLTTCPVTTPRVNEETSREIPSLASRSVASKLRAVDCPELPFVRSTLAGCVEGYSYDWQGNIVERYLAIPYAEPPTGPRRFVNPVTVAPWADTKSVRDFGKICPQTPVYNESTMDEDCLSLSVYVPQSNSTAPLPVLVWIHGGGNQIGSGNDHQGDALATLGNIIVVIVNYRLGSLGFLTTDDDASRGNYGLLDQHLAISWVKDNIANFGGDPNSLTIAGNSAGGADAHYHTLSPMTDSLGITQVVLESAPVMPFDDMKQRASAARLAEDASCDTTQGNQAMVDCLRQLQIGELIAAVESASLTFHPTIDGVFLPDHPRTLAEDTLRVSSWTYLIGVNNGDGSVGWSSAQNAVDEAGYHDCINNRFFTKYGWRTNSIDEHYAYYEDLEFFGDVRKIQKSLIQAIGDEAFIFPAHMLAIDYSQLGSDVYFYYYTCPEVPSPNFMGPEWIGAPHAAEIAMVFGTVLDDPDQGESVKQLSRNIIEYWTNFVKTGDPNDGGEEVSDLLAWPKFRNLTSNKNYIVLDTGNNTAVSSNLRPADDAFWNDYMPRQSVYCEAPVVPMTTTTTAPSTDPESPLVSTTNGNVVGKRVRNEHFDIHVFMGIPYAKPPIGELRLAKPQAAEDWTTTLDATTPKAPCPQLNGNNAVVGSEDCLYLDVFMPTGVIGTNAKSMPVMIWIHGDFDGNVGHIGGSFWSGGGSPGWSEDFNYIDPSYLAHFGSVMVVRPNFRLGSLGFLTTGDDVIKGNYGLWDLQAAVDWTVANAPNFGGDPEKLTVFGQGSGAVMAEMLGVLPPTDLQVKRVISQSGSAFSPWSFCDASTCTETADQLASSLSCQGDSFAVLDCLRSASVEDIVSSVPFIPFEGSDANSEYNAWGTWRLRKDGDIIPNENLEVLFSDAKFEYMTGTTTHEFYRHLEASYSSQMNTSLEIAIADTSRFLYGSPKWTEETLALLKHSYTPWDDPDDSEAIQNSAVKYYGDFLFASSTGKSIESITSSTSNFYEYVLTRGLNASTEGQAPRWLGACHGDDVVYQFGIPVMSPSEYSDKDREFSHTFMSHWTNFAWSGNPNTAFSNKNWRTYDTDANFIQLGGRRSLRKPTNYNVEKNALWNEVIPILEQAVEPTSYTTDLQPTSDGPTVGDNLEEEDCVDPIPAIGKGLGLNLTPEEADTAIYAMFSVCLILGVTLTTIFFVWCVRSRKSKKRLERYGQLNGSFISGGKPDDYLQRQGMVSAL